MENADVQQYLIEQWQAGWNDAMCGRAAQSRDMTYLLGYYDARR